MTQEDACGLLLCDDLIFASRVSGVAEDLGLRVRSAATVGALVQLARATPPRCVIVDLHAPGLAIEKLLCELSALERRPMVIGYGSHVDTAALKNARDAGCDIVWPRSKFVAELPMALPEWMRVPSV